MKKIITGIIDKNLQRWIELELNMLPVKTVEPEMSDPHQDLSQEWKKWMPVASKVTDEEIIALEKAIGYELPDSYKIFLQHKHFYELHISDAWFCAHIVNNWQRGLIQMIFDGYPTEFLIDKGFIPFAMFSDWGHLCFNTAKKTTGNEYEIVLWDHDDWDTVAFKYQNFTEMLVALAWEEDDQHAQ